MHPLPRSLALLLVLAAASGASGAELTGPLATQPRIPISTQAPPGPGDAKLAEARGILLELDDSAEHLGQVLRACDEALALGLAPPRQAEAQAWKALVAMRFGDHSRDEERKLAFYEQGRREAEKGIAADPKSAVAHFYRGANMGRWGLARGVLHSLFLISDLRHEFELARALDPANVDALVALGKVEQEVPGLLGGSTDRAEKLFRSALLQDPHFTRGMLDLAELLDRTGRRTEALAWVARAHDEPAPTRPGEWRNYDRWRADQLLKKWVRK